jgi:hypothetical protein
MRRTKPPSSFESTSGHPPQRALSFDTENRRHLQARTDWTDSPLSSYRINSHRRAMGECVRPPWLWGLSAPFSSPWRSDPSEVCKRAARPSSPPAEYRTVHFQFSQFKFRQSKCLCLNPPLNYHGIKSDLQLIKHNRNCCIVTRRSHERARFTKA